MRKIRMAGHNRGKSGGFRVLYVLFLDRTAALLLDGYSKSQKADLSADEVKELVSLQSLIVADLTALSQPSKSEDE